MKMASGLVTAAIGSILFATACSESGAGGREVKITQSEDGCTPASVTASGGEKLQLVVTNDSDIDVYEVEGIEGTKVEEFVVPGGKTRKVGYTVPDGADTHKLKCYTPGGVSTIIDIVADGGGTASGGVTPESDPEAGETEGASSGSADTEVVVKLNEFTVSADKTTVKAGTIEFEAMNESASMVHELAVLKPKSDGTFDNLGEIEDIDPGKGGEVKLELEPGKYELACLIVPGEAGSTVDHFQQGMRLEFTVE